MIDICKVPKQGLRRQKQKVRPRRKKTGEKEKEDKGEGLCGG